MYLVCTSSHTSWLRPLVCGRLMSLWNSSPFLSVVSVLRAVQDEQGHHVHVIGEHPEQGEEAAPGHQLTCPFI